MNKKALQNADTQKYELKKEEPIGSSNMGTAIIFWTIVPVIVLLVLLLVFCFLL